MSAHDINHLIGCFGLMMTFARFNWTRLTTILVVVALGLLWECFDMINHVASLSIPFLDSRGWDIKDMIYDVVGVAIATLILNVTKRSK